MQLKLLRNTMCSVLASLLVVTCLIGNGYAFDSSGLGTIKFSELSKEAQRTIALIRQDGPYPYEKDGSKFGNYEKRLPQQKRGYYREFTVKTPYLRGRGAKRIIAGGWQRPPTEYYFTADHYKSFKLILD